MYYKNISLHLAYLQMKKKIAKLLFSLNKTFKSSIYFDFKIQSVLSVLRICVYIIFILEMYLMLKKLFIIC